MKTVYRPLVLYLLLPIVALLITPSLNAQSIYCDSAVPTFNVDLSASPNMTWTSPPIQRDGSCCGSVSPDVCLEFVITLNPNAIAVNFLISSGAVPPGALYYQINCGPITPVGSPICLSGPGPHHLTFCKPGNNMNTFSVVSYPDPVIGPDITLNAGCQGFIYGNYYNEASVTWTSIAPGNMGDYDYLLSCTSGCDTAYVTAPPNPPAYIDYYVCGMDIAGCNPNPICDTIRVNFIPPVAVTVTSADTYLCPTEQTTVTATVSGGTPPYSYNWSNGSTSSSMTVGPGTYSVDVTDASGCLIVTDVITVQQYPQPVIDAGPDVSACQGTSITLTATGGTFYQWNNGIINGVPFGQAVGTTTYIVEGNDANGCNDSDTVLVTINPLPTVSGGPDLTVCEGEYVTLAGAGANSYVWSGGISNGVPFLPSVSTTLYTVTGTDLNGCVNTDVVQVNVNPLPNVQAGPDLTVCSDEYIVLSASGGSNYSWDNNVTNNVGFQQAPGTMVYTVVGTDTNGCAASDQLIVTVNALPVVYAGPDQTVCEGTPVVLIATGASTYVWTGNVQNAAPFVPPVGQNTYVVDGTDYNSCTQKDTVVVTVNPKPIVNAGPDQTLCEGTEVILVAQGTENMVWSGGVQNLVPFFQAVGTQSYIAYDTLPTGCFNSDTVVVEMLPAPEVSATDTVICEGEIVALMAYGADQYTWSNGIPNGQYFSPGETAVYTVIGSLTNGCTDTASITIVVNPNPTADFYWTNTDLNTDDPATGFNNYSTGAVSYLWDFGDGSANSTLFEPHHVYPSEEGGAYTVTLTATSEFGCTDVASLIIEIEQTYSIYVPNAFTPDGSNLNEVFTPVMYGFDEQEYVMYIFNRWGELVFETHNMSVGWDGSYAGRYDRAQDGTYIWKIQAKVLKSSKRMEFVGHVNLIK